MSLTGRILWLALVLLPAMCGATEAAGVVTILDGDGFIVRKAQKLQLKPGSKVFAQDLLQTGDKSTLVRVELNKGGVFDLGPASFAIVRPGASGPGGKSAALYLLKGWLKVSNAAGNGPGSPTAGSEHLEVMNVPGSAVVSVLPDSFQVFAESGALSIVDKRTGKSAAATPLQTGSLYIGFQNEKAAISPRVPGAFIQSVPKGFQDAIPPLMDSFKSRPEQTPKVLGDISYAEATPWLASEPMVRSLLLSLWKNPLPAELRQGLASHIDAHPEWRSTLFPEKDLLRKNPVAAAPGN